MNDSKTTFPDHELNRLILEAVLDDIEAYETIQSKISRFKRAEDDALSDSEFETRLIRLLSEELIGAFLLHADAPYITPVDPQSVPLATCWFYISDKGRKLLQGDCPAEASEEASLPSRTQKSA